MKNLKFLIAFIALILISCERDDICSAATQTTPVLNIAFYDASDTDELKNAPRITVYGDGLLETDDEGNAIEPTESSDITLKYNENTNSLELPLVVGPENQTITSRYVLEIDTDLRLDDDEETNSNKDIITIEYETEFVYVSRACGYKSIFKNLIIYKEADEDEWITNIEIIEPTVQNENTTHVHIFH